MKILLTSIFALWFLNGCAALPSGTVTHVVVLWLKEPGDAGQRAALIRASEEFRKIPGVRSVRAGACIPSVRPIVDSSFDVALTMEFASKADMQRYLDHPAHRAAAETVLKPLVKKITVFDFGPP